MRNSIFLFLATLTAFPIYSQKDIGWQDLAEVTFVDKYYPKYNQEFPYPTFSESVKALEGKEITISGYFLNLDASGKLYILSKGPLSACFFCGVGGPETAIELYFEEKPSFTTDEIISVTGTLELNPDDPEHFTYILRKTKGIKFN